MTRRPLDLDIYISDGLRPVGGIVFAGKKRFAAYDGEDRKLGEFSDLKAARAAVAAAKGGGR